MDKDCVIKDVIVQKLKQIIDDRGRVMHMLRVDNPLYQNFGEIYFSEILPGVVKAWKRHKKMTQLIAVPIGKIKLVIYDGREGSESQYHSQVMEIGRDNYCLVKIPFGLWYGFKCISDIPAIIVNCTDLPHDIEESENIDLFELSILWGE
jgi:dTDP-4-dehydrorhamnose 3,5-epimerase